MRVLVAATRGTRRGEAGLAILSDAVCADAIPPIPEWAQKSSLNHQPAHSREWPRLPGQSLYGAKDERVDPWPRGRAFPEARPQKSLGEDGGQVISKTL